MKASLICTGLILLVTGAGQVHSEITSNYLCRVLDLTEVRFSDTFPVELSAETRSLRERKPMDGEFFFLASRFPEKTAVNSLRLTLFQMWNDQRWGSIEMKIVPSGLFNSDIISASSEPVIGRWYLADLDQKTGNLLVRQRERSVWIIERTYTATCEETPFGTISEVHRVIRGKE